MIRAQGWADQQQMRRLQVLREAVGTLAALALIVACALKW